MTRATNPPTPRSHLQSQLVCVWGGGAGGGVQCLQEGAGSWWREFALSRHSGTLPPSGKGLGASAVSQEMAYHPHRKEPEVGASQRWKNNPQSWPGSCGAGRAHGGLDGQLIWTLGP